MRLTTRTLTTLVLVGICLTAFTVGSPVPAEGDASTGDEGGNGGSKESDEEILEWARNKKRMQY
ncbi:hypothetical protein BJ684DRAFT_19866 [Piptocephalis cylindrospora]|uniref:Uncharacterized protein n=1 Tax=Piptocephalis cylindrospora TaxID=1907219 RepID=A0A4V1IY83_9FUNG|nr:hypothetical protein BJ684DRAFT_19866 [Piptocephalis cylindrospora]|eukprot:RKP13659.1 hypothetical protein BJ684DRAFT_19866 [Piptocephalis cylindrospora]